MLFLLLRGLSEACTLIRIFTVWGRDKINGTHDKTIHILCVPKTPTLSNAIIARLFCLTSLSFDKCRGSILSDHPQQEKKKTFGHLLSVLGHTEQKNSSGRVLIWYFLFCVFLLFIFLLELFLSKTRAPSKCI